jgi:predicted PurR-regulated permease PerM
VPEDRLLTAPQWLRDLGRTSWLLVGIALVVVAAVCLLSLTRVIVMPVLTAAVVASVASLLVGWLQRHRVPRGLGSAIVLLGAVVVGAGIVVLILGGILSQTDDLSGHLSSAKDTLGGWLQDLGVNADRTESAKQGTESALEEAVPALLNGVVDTLGVLSSLVFFLALTVLSLFFLLKDGPEIRAWAEQHMSVPAPVARVATDRVVQSMRGYFVGVTAVAVFNAVLVGVGALVLGVPLAGTIAIVTFVGAYIPYLGAWSAGIFAVLVALGGAGTDAAIGMVVVQLLANGILQQMIQPIAYGAALGIHPLAVLIVTIAGGALFGAAGLILAAPLTSAATRISADLATLRAAPLDDAAAAPPPAALVTPTG